METSTLLVSTWADGVFALTRGRARGHELAGRAITALVPDGRGGALAIVDAHEVHRRAPDGAWTRLATTDADLACAVAAGEMVYLGTDDARVLRLGADGALTDLRGLASVPGRETWYAGQALVDGRMMGPPLGVRSITMTADGAALLANVHVGGIPRSTDGGATWHPTIAVDADVHEVRAHPTRPEIVVAAAAVGLCVSRDGGATWTVEREPSRPEYCSAVAFVGDDVLVAASEHHFAPSGCVYRRSVEAPGKPLPMGEGFPDGLAGICDTRLIDARGDVLVVADQGGDVYVSEDAGRRWARRARGVAGPSSVVVL